VKSSQAIWARKGLALYPASEDAEAQLRSLKSGQEVMVAIKTPRSLKQLRLWWLLMGLLVDADLFPTKEVASNETKIACGHCDMGVVPDTGEVRIYPKSIAIESMAHVPFCTLFEAAINVISARWMQGVTREAIKREIYATIDGPQRVGERAT
jgi:hypothetical protein